MADDVKTTETTTEKPVVEQTTTTTTKAPADPGILATDGEEKKETPVAATWPEDWRKTYAGDNEKLLKQMERYSSPKAAFDALIALKQKVSKGDVQKVL